ncbi:preprotein translocase subunit Sec61beta [Candidatus Micrarchaeota archaeon]|nr:preprotein translocase subunit Sec61beta [Candidatus Micrarchaeota archaeon]
MAERDRITTPSSSTGLIRFYDVTASNVLVDPKGVIGVCIGIIVLELLLQAL